MHANSKDLTGQRFGSLVVLELTDLRLKNKRTNVWKCRCDCGNICYKTSDTLKDKRHKTCSCGCQNKSRRSFPNKFVSKEEVEREKLLRKKSPHGNVKDMTGQRFGHLVVLELTDMKPEKRRGTIWKCRCDCGNICYKTSMSLKDKRNKTNSCGCTIWNRSHIIADLTKNKEAMKTVYLQTYPYASQQGKMEVPTNLSPEEEDAYINEHWNKFVPVGEPELDYAGTDFARLDDED